LSVTRVRHGSSRVPAHPLAAVSNARQRSRKHSGSPWPRLFTRKTGLPRIA